MISGVVGSKAHASRWLAIAPRLGFGRRSYRRRLAGVAADLALGTHVLFERAELERTAAAVPPAREALEALLIRGGPR